MKKGVKVCLFFVLLSVGISQKTDAVGWAQSAYDAVVERIAALRERINEFRMRRSQHIDENRRTISESGLSIKKSSNKGVFIDLTDEESLKARIAALKEKPNFSSEEAFCFYNKNQEILKKIHLINTYLSRMAEEFDIKRHGVRYHHWKEVEELNDLLSDPTQLYKNGTSTLQLKEIAAKLMNVLNVINRKRGYRELDLREIISDDYNDGRPFQINFEPYLQNISDLWKRQAKKRDFNVLRRMPLSQTLVEKEKPTYEELTALANSLNAAAKDPQAAKVDENGKLWVKNAKGFIEPKPINNKYLIPKTTYPSNWDELGPRWRIYRDNYSAPQIKQK